MPGDCLICNILMGHLESPGGVIYEDSYWLVDHVLPPIFIRGQLICKLKRHGEHLADLTLEEAQALGPMVQKTCKVLQDITGAKKVHVASYGEGIQHIHFLITPRTADLPASNIYLSIWLLWRRLMFRLGWKRFAYATGEAAEVASQVRARLESHSDS